MNIFRHFKQTIETIVENLAASGKLPAGLDLSAVATEPPRDAAHGDMATNAALVLAKPAGMRPRELAEMLCGELRRAPGVESAEIAGPGFINLRLADRMWHDRVADILAAGVDYGATDIGGGTRVNVEYVSANPTGPLHIGHCRGAVYGDALAALLEKAGYQVAREYYINDAGAQIDTLARSAYLRYREALGEDIGEIPEGLYPGDYLKPVGAALARRDGDKWLDSPESDWLGIFRDFASEAMMDMIREDLAALGIRQEIFSSERALHDKGEIEKALQTLEEAGLIHVGVLEPPKGKRIDDWEARPQTLFRSTRFGDDVDRALRKSDGGWTYFASDIAYHFDKFERGFGQMIDVWGADHGGYVKRMKAAVRAITGGQGELDVRLCQLVRLSRGGQPVKMSKRAGSFIALADVVREVGKDVVRFIMLTRKNDAPLDFDFASVTEQSRDNPVFYVQYAHARVHSVLRNAARDVSDLNLSAEGLAEADFSALGDPAELGLVKLLAGWPRLIESAALAHEPHRLAFYLYDVAAAFHALWNKGKENPDLRFIIAGRPAVTRSRLALLRAVATVIASGLAIMGVEPVEEMH
ncbi:MAG: arginine--tRNA ligase [Sphingomonadales bacterium]